MNKNRYGRSGYVVGKGREEKAAYQKFLASKTTLDKTVKDPVDTSKTGESSFEEDVPKDVGVTKKSIRLRVKDFFSDNLAVTIFGGLLLILVTGYISLNREQGEQGVRIDNLARDIKNAEEINQKNNDVLVDIKEKYTNFTVSVAKDLEYIKKKIKL